MFRRKLFGQKRLAVLVFWLAGFLAACAPTPTSMPQSTAIVVPATATVMLPIATPIIPPTLAMPTPMTIPIVTTGQPLEFVLSITGDPNPFSRVLGVAVDAEQNIYALDAGNYHIQKFDRNGKFLTMWGSRGNGDGQFVNMMSCCKSDGRLTVDSEGSVYAVDGNSQIQKFDRNGKFLLRWGSPGDGEGQFSFMFDIATDKQNNVYITYYNHNEVQKFDKYGKFLTRWGKTGFKDGQFVDAKSVAIDSTGNVFITDSTGRIQKFDSNGVFQSKLFPETVDNRGIDVYALAIDSQDNFYIGDYTNNRIIKLDSGGKILAVWGIGGKSEGQFISIQKIDVDREGNIYVSDWGNNRIQKFRQPMFRP